MREPIVIHTEDDYEAAQQRVEELSAATERDSESEHELAALAEAMLAFELRRDESAE